MAFYCTVGAYEIFSGRSRKGDMARTKTQGDIERKMAKECIQI